MYYTEETAEIAKQGLRITAKDILINFIIMAVFMLPIILWYVYN